MLHIHAYTSIVEAYMDITFIDRKLCTRSTTNQGKIVTPKEHLHITKTSISEI